MLQSQTLSILFLASLFATGESHGYLLSPRSRNFIAWQVGVWSGATESDYPKEDCPHCANHGGTSAQCGIIGSKNYDANLNFFGNPMPADPQMQYVQGQNIEVEVVLTAHHKGHFEFSACPIENGEIPSLECFTSHPLEFVSDPLYGAIRDENYPNRAYIAPRNLILSDNTGVPGNLFRFILKLPDDLTGDLVLLQWHYITANSCVPSGYDSYPFPPEWNESYGANICGPIPLDGNGVPEQFWNCAEIDISREPIVPTSVAPMPVAAPTLATVETNSPTTTPSVTPSALDLVPVAAPVTAPVQTDAPTTPTSSPTAFAVVPTAAPIIPPVQTDGPTITPTVAPSTMPVAPPTDAPLQTYAPTFTPTIAPSVMPVAAPTSALIETSIPSTTQTLNPTVAAAPITAPVTSPSFIEGTCGNGHVGNGICSDFALCCSKWGFCGSSSQHCGDSQATQPPTNPRLPWEQWMISDEPRCGVTEAEARGYCGMECFSDENCPSGQHCWAVYANYCGSKPIPDKCTESDLSAGFRCGLTEVLARETCGPSCTADSDCMAAGETCHEVNPNFCNCLNTGSRMLRGQTNH